MTSSEVHETSAGLDDEIAKIERLLAEKRDAKAKRAGQRRIMPVPREGALACTFQQEGLWFEHQLNPLSGAYHISFALRLAGPLDTDALQRALHALVVRHEALRTRIVDHGGLPRQIIDPPPADFPLPISELAPGQVQSWATEQVAQPMNLSHGPLVRAMLARTGTGQHVLVLVMHHIIGDGWSARILASELSQLYTADTTGTTAALGPLPIQPADHAAWQRGWLSGAELERQLGFWRDALAGLPTVDFPADRPRPAQPTGEGATVVRMLPDEIGVLARGYTRTHQVSLLAVLHAALLTVLHRWTGQHDLPIGSVFSGRTRAETEPLVGFFVNPLVLRTRLDGNPTFTGLVRRCHDTILDATAHQDIPFSLVVDSLQPERVTGRHPLFQINLSLYPPGAMVGGLELSGIAAEPMPLGSSTAHNDMAIGVTHAPDGTLEVSAEYSTELFDADRTQRLLDHFAAALAAGLAAPGRPVGEIELMGAGERDQVLHAHNRTAVDYPPRLLHHLVETAAATTPDALAVIDHDGTRYTYRQLNTAASQLAHRLRRHGAGPAIAAGICLHRSMDLVTALLATWKAGAAYVPLDPDLPADRLSYLIADAGLAVIITTTADRRALGHTAAGDARPSVIMVDAERDALSRGPAHPAATAGPNGSAGLDDTAYVLYTSGSTGTPKGVAISHRGVHNRIAWMQDTYPLAASDRVLQKTPYGFDVSVWEFFWPLSAGATLVLAAPGGHKDPHYLHRLIIDEDITTMHFVPSMLNTFLDTIIPRYPLPGPLARLRQVFCSGEALPPETVRRFLSTWPEIELHNLYGPTEASIDVTAWHCHEGSGPVPIGHPIANHRAYVLDACLRPAPIGVPGQLFIAGVGLAHGYLNRPALTAERFLADPFSDRPGERMYATGDLTRRRPNGILDYLGRTDRQVKLRGQRVELAEIEHALTQHPAVRQAAVTLHRGALAAYLVPRHGIGGIDQTALREFLADRLPTYMIPARLLTIAELPLTASGKLDTARLPDPTPQATGYLAPRTPTEQWLATAWADLLGTDRVSVHDSFFELGGNSLQATQLIARVADGLSVHLHPRRLFTHPVLQQLATLVDQTTSQRAGGQTGATTGALSGLGSEAGLVVFRSAGTRPPIFLVHPVGGSVACYVQLAQALGDGHPVYAIEDPALHGGQSTAGLAARAGRYIQQVRRQQPAGPYLVGGWSLGGLIAHEMARQLSGAGEDVTAFALDAGTPPEQRIPTDLEVAAEFVIDLAGAAGAPLPDVDPDVLRELDRDSLEKLALDVLIDAGVAPPDMRAELRTRLRAFAANYRAALGHEPGRFDGPMVLITAAENDATQEITGWMSLAPALEHRTVGGDHYTMLRPPHLTTLATALRDALDGAHRSPGVPPCPGRPVAGAPGSAPGSSDPAAPPHRP